ncbi:MAG: hypothetical protein ACUVRP_12465 [Chlorobiales bacterium]
MRAWRLNPHKPPRLFFPTKFGEQVLSKFLSCFADNQLAITLIKKREDNPDRFGKSERVS